MMETNEGATVLLVEDSQTQMAFFRGMLEKDGYKVRTAKNGAEALICLGEEMAEMIISDCNMPLLDGFQLCRLLKDHPTTRHIPFLLLTGSPNRLSRFWARTCGADRFLLKDGPPDQFLDTVRVLIKAAQVRQAAEDSGIWLMGLKQISPLKIEDLTMQLSRALEHRLLEITVRNAVASLEQHLHDPSQLAWGFLNLLQDLVSPGALYFLCPSACGHVCYLITSPSISQAALDGFLKPLDSLPFIRQDLVERQVRTMDWSANTTHCWPPPAMCRASGACSSNRAPT
jgi:CheY-like chemotaxis protein